MLHARMDYDCIQPWPTKRKHIFRSYDAFGGSSIVDGTTWPDSVVDEEFGTEQAGPIIPEDEPVLLLRGQDMLGAKLCRLYARSLDAPGQDHIKDALMRHADRMEAWADAHPHGPTTVAAEVLR